MKRVTGYWSLALAVILLFTGPGLACPAGTFPETIPLPDGWRPEGIAVGRGTDFYVGSLANGAIYQGNLRTGKGDILVPGVEGRVAVGLSFDERTGYLWVAGGPTGFAYVYDTRTGEQVAALPLTGSASFINDVVVTQSAAFFTNSSAAVLYRIDVMPNGRLPAEPDIQELPLGGDWQQVADQFNANGIDATPNGQTLIVVHSYLGNLYRVDPETGTAGLIDLGGDTVTNGDGILLDGRTLYVVRNFLNQIAVVELAPDLASGQVVDTLPDPAFRIPTTVAEFGKFLYAVNARFDVAEPGPDTEYEVVQVPKR